MRPVYGLSPPPPPSSCGRALISERHALQSPDLSSPLSAQSPLPCLRPSAIGLPPLLQLLNFLSTSLFNDVLQSPALCTETTGFQVGLRWPLLPPSSSLAAALWAPISTQTSRSHPCLMGAPAQLKFFVSMVEEWISRGCPAPGPAAADPPIARNPLLPARSPLTSMRPVAAEQGETGPRWAGQSAAGGGEHTPADPPLLLSAPSPLLPTECECNSTPRGMSGRPTCAAVTP